MGTCSTTVSPNPSRPVIFLGLFVRILIVVSPTSARIWLPIPQSRASAGKPSSMLASTVSAPVSCSSYALSLFSSPIPRPSWSRYTTTPRPSAAIISIAVCSCQPGLGDARDEPLRAQAVGDELRHGDEGQPVLRAEALELRAPRRGAVVV